MGVRYETNRWGVKVAMAEDGPLPIRLPNPNYNPDKDADRGTTTMAPTPQWIQDIFDRMKDFDPTEKT